MPLHQWGSAYEDLWANCCAFVYVLCRRAASTTLWRLYVYVEAAYGISESSTACLTLDGRHRTDAFQP